MATPIDGLEEAFLAFAVPQELLFDQMNAVITRDTLAYSRTFLNDADLGQHRRQWLRRARERRRVPRDSGFEARRHDDTTTPRHEDTKTRWREDTTA